MDFIEDYNLLEIYSDYVKEPFFLNLEEIIDLFDTSSIEKTKERIKILFTENAEFLTERMFSKNEIFYRGRAIRTLRTNRHDKLRMAGRSSGEYSK